MRILTGSFRSFIVVGFAFCLPIATQSATAATITWTGTTGNWATSGNWSNGSVPSGANSYGINNNGTAIIDSLVANVNDVSLGWPTGNSNSGNLEIHQDGSLSTLTSDGMYVGVRPSGLTSTFTMTGGTLDTTSGAGHIVVADETGSKGTVEIFAGTLTVGGNLRIGINGTARFRIQGNAPVINVAGNLSVKENSQSATDMYFEIGVAGISPINVAGNTSLDNNPILHVSLIGLAPQTDLPLINTGTLSAGSEFYQLAQGDPVSATFGLTTYNWTIDYNYLGGADVALVFVSVETVPEPGTAALAGMGFIVFGYVARRRRNAITG